MPKKKDMSYAEMGKVVGKDFLKNSMEAKAVRAVAKSTIPGMAASAAGKLAKKAKDAYNMWKYDGAPVPGSKEESDYKDYVASMGSKAWAKEKKKAGVRD